MTPSGTGWLSDRRLELYATILLAMAAVATAWASYQSSRWHGKQAQAQSASIAARVESSKAAGVANRQVQIDVGLFTQWVDAYATGETELADFYRHRFREEFEPAFEAWIATRPLRNPRAPLSPFAMPEYELASTKEAERLVTGVPGLTLTLDYTHFTRLGMPDSAVEPLVKYASHFHVRGAREGRLQAAFKANAIDYARVLRAMRDSGYKGYLGIEYVWIDWEHCNEVDNLSETILFRDFLRTL